MLLYLVRHGIAIDRRDPKCPPEAERYLTPEGVEKTKRVAEGLAELDPAADLLISSTFVRALQTAEIFAQVLGYQPEKILQTEALLPAGDPEALFRELAKHKQAKEVFCFGHAPQLDEALGVALGLQHPITALKKAGVACVELDEIVPPAGTLVWLCVPKILRRL